MAQKQIKDWTTQALADDDWLIKQSAGGVTGKNSLSALRTLLSLYAGEYSATFTYAQNQIVNSGGILYKSLQNTNLNKTPASEPTWWDPLIKSQVILDTTLASAVQNYDISSLSAKALELFITGKNGEATLAAAYSLYINGDYTAANYHRNGISVTNGAAPAGYEAASPAMLTINAGDSYHYHINLHCGPVAPFMDQIFHFRDASDNLLTRFQTCVYNGTNPSTISSIRIATDRASGIGIGTRIILRSLEI